MGKIFIGNIKGQKGDKGDKGDNTPIKGVDYWTPEDKEEIHNDTATMIDEVLNGGNIVKYTFNEDLDESTFPESYFHRIYFDFETLEPLKDDFDGDIIQHTKFKGIHYGLNWGDEGGYFIHFLTVNETLDGTNEIWVSSCENNSEVAEIANENAKILIINKDTLTDEARAFLEANGTFEGNGLTDRVSALEKKIAELEALLLAPKTYGTYEFVDTWDNEEECLTEAGNFIQDLISEGGQPLKLAGTFKVEGDDKTFPFLYFYNGDGDEGDAVIARFGKDTDFDLNDDESGMIGAAYLTDFEGWGQNQLTGKKIIMLEEPTGDFLEMLNNCCTKIA